MLVTQPVHAWGIDAHSDEGWLITSDKGKEMSDNISLQEKIDQLENELSIQKAANRLVFGALITSINALYPNKDLQERLTKLTEENLNPKRVENIPNIHEAFLEASRILRTDKSPE